MSFGFGQGEADDIMTDGEHSWYLICHSGNTHAQNVAQRSGCLSAYYTYKDKSISSADSGWTLH